MIRVFSKDPARIASDEVLSAYETAVNTRKMEQTKELGGVKVNDLPGPESLLQEGTEEGQTRLVRQPNGKILCYQWTKGNWECVGDVMGAAGGTQETSGKSLYEGQEYDFVFNVDIEDGKPAIKLPFNRSEDPWMAAQKFIYKHDLPQVYLEQVANFIIQNANLTTIPVQQSDYCDPFTGGGRYVPMTGESSSTSGNGNAAPAAAPAVNVNFRERSSGNQNSGIVNVDPFTGGSSYSSGKQEFIVNKHIPWTTFLTFDACDPSKVLIKLKEFNNQFPEGNLRVTNDQLESVINLISSKTPSDDAIKSFTQIMNWPNEKLFPVLDILRLAIRNEATCGKLGTFDIIEYLTKRLTTTSANQLMSIRAFSNMSLHETGKILIESRINDICNLISSIAQGNANLQSAITTFYLNQSIIQRDVMSDEICTILSLACIRSLEWINDNESVFKGYQALGNLITFNGGAVSSILKAADTLKNTLEKNKNGNYEKLAEIASELTEKLI
jgi:phospholipase A-2-activating protein